MRSDVVVEVSAAERQRLAALVADRRTPQKHVWHARIILFTADGVDTMAIVRRTGVSKPTVWRWQRRFMEAGVDGLLRDKTRPPGKPPLAPAVVEQVVAMTCAAAPGLLFPDKVPIRVRAAC